MPKLPKMIICIIYFTNFATLLKCFCVFVGSSTQIMEMTNITTTPFLPDNKIATGYSGLKLMIVIEAADLYQSCSWMKDGIFSMTIFNGFISCGGNNDEIKNRRFSCVKENQVVRATVTFVSSVNIDDNGNYQVQCLNDSLAEFNISQLNIMVMGKTSCHFG